MSRVLEGLRRRVLRRVLLSLARPRFRVAGADIVVPPGVLNPTAFRASLGFARAAIEAAPDEPADVLELGCGAGLAATLLARAGHRVTATDIDPRAVIAAAGNARRSSVPLQALACDWDAALAPTARYDLVVVNPPFLTEDAPVLRRALSAGPGLEVVAAALAAVARRLRPQGRGLLLTSERSGRSRVRVLVEGADLALSEERVFRCWGERYHLDLLRLRGPRRAAEVGS